MCDNEIVIDLTTFTLARVGSKGTTNEQKVRVLDSLSQC